MEIALVALGQKRSEIALVIDDDQRLAVTRRAKVTVKPPDVPPVDSSKDPILKLPPKTADPKIDLKKTDPPPSKLGGGKMGGTPPVAAPGKSGGK